MDCRREISPNPSSGRFEIKIASVAETSLIQIVNPVGEILFSEKVYGKKELTVDVNLAKGIYFIRVDDAVKKLIVE